MDGQHVFDVRALSIAWGWGQREVMPQQDTRWGHHSLIQNVQSYQSRTGPATFRNHLQAFPFIQQHSKPPTGSSYARRTHMGTKINPPLADPEFRGRIRILKIMRVLPLPPLARSMQGSQKGGGLYTHANMRDEQSEQTAREGGRNPHKRQEDRREQLRVFGSCWLST